MHHYQNQLSQTTINNNKGISNPIVTLPIDQIHVILFYYKKDVDKLNIKIICWK